MTSPPRPPSPPPGPPFGTNFSRRKLTLPRPPLPAWAKTLIRSTNMVQFFVKQLERSSVEVSMRLRHLTLIGFLIFAPFCYAQTSSTPMPETGIEGVITISPSHGGAVRAGIPSSKPLANTTFVISNQAGPVTEFTTDDEGH